LCRPRQRRNGGYYESPASAGKGKFIDNPEYEIMKFDEAILPRGTDYGVRISGDSMEPKIRDGDIVFYREQDYLDDGDIGIFKLGDEVFCKKLDKSKHQLVSLNPKYDPIQLTEYDPCVAIGKVLLP
jgi:phage repressor protein C with HTH and peptisase S24 domain